MTSQPVFVRRAHLTAAHIAAIIVSTAALGFALARTLHHHAPITAAAIAVWFVLCMIGTLNLRHLVYLIVDSDTVRQRRYLFTHIWSRRDIGGLVRVDIAYPGMQGQTISAAILAGHDGTGLAGVIPLTRWTPAEIGGLEQALGVPVADDSGSPVTPADLARRLPGSMTGLEPYVAYFQIGAIVALILLVTVAITIGVVGHH